MTRQGAASPRLAPRDAYWSRFLGPFRNGCSSTIPNLSVSRGWTRSDPNLGVRIDTLHSRPPYTSQKTLRLASRAFNSRFRGFPAGLSGGDPILKRSHGDPVAI